MTDDSCSDRHDETCCSVSRDGRSAAGLFDRPRHVGLGARAESMRRTVTNGTVAGSPTNGSGATR
ncbi:hypothetical protein C9J85_16440 [Haloferax sp. wsp5]|nr:hypothetical protein C9J85_16440 [Haloferax sp. wsp5]